MRSRLISLTRELAAVAQAVHARGLCRGSSGNVSMRCDGGMLVSRSGVSLAETTESDIVEVRFNGQIDPRIDAQVKGHIDHHLPTSEWRLHQTIYERRAEVGAVVHTHSRYAMALACLRVDIPAFHYMVAAVGGAAIRCAPYAPFGSLDLAEAAVEALRNRRACLLANHGAVAVGPDPWEALAMAEELEDLAGGYWTCLAAGTPQVLSQAEMDDVLLRFKDYESGKM